MLYSYKGQTPAPLPFRITLPDGSSRTDPQTFTDEEISAAGYVGPIAKPDYDPVTHELQWDGNKFLVTEPPPQLPQPDWVTFKAAALSSSSLNAILAEAYRLVPVAASALVPALLKAENGSTDDFKIAWSEIAAATSIPDDLIASFQQTAEECNLPISFTEVLSPFRIRAHNADGTFRADDPSTPQNEAWQ